MIDEIYEEIRKRNITRLCHFVHTNVLLHILNNNEGVKAVDFINQDVLIQNDKLRLDGNIPIFEEYHLLNPKCLDLMLLLQFLNNLLFLLHIHSIFGHNHIVHIFQLHFSI